MAIKVVDGIIRHNNDVFETGDIITGLSAEEEARFIYLKVAENVGIERKAADSPAEPEIENRSNSGEGDEGLNINFSPDEYVEAANSKKGRK